MRSVTQIVPLELDCEGGATCFPEEEEEEGRSESVVENSAQLIEAVSEVEEEDSGGETTTTTTAAPGDPTPVITGRQPEAPSRTLRRAAQRAQEKWRELVESGSV